MDLISGHVYKPDRVLFYIRPTEEELNEFYKGVIPEKIMAYDGCFGTYDCPGFYRINTEDSIIEVIGIEFRPDDERIDYPTDLESIRLEKGFMISVMYANEQEISGMTLVESMDYISENVTCRLFNEAARPMKNPTLIQFHNLHNMNRYYIQAEDMSEENYYKRIRPETENEKELYQIAYHDFITGHYNWNYIWPIITGFGFYGIQDFAFAHFDVKSFNSLNVVYGHDVANNVLTRIVDHLNKQDWIYCSARCHNDNFAMMIKDMPEEELVAKLTTFFDEISLLEEDENYHIYYRCGVVPMKNCIMLGDRVADAGKEMQRRGNKLYETEVLLYTDDMHDELDWATRIKAYVDTAIENDEFLIYLQPKYDIETEEIHGAEALIRWKYRGREMISPGRFIPIFEKSGLIGKIDDIVLNKVCACFKRWKEEGRKLYPISVNLSRMRFGETEIIDHLIEIVDNYGVDHSLIDFELTESAAYNNPEFMLDMLTKLKENGFRISMDDFGTGYSSLSLLTEMPMDTIKIDKSFVDGIGTESKENKECIVTKNIIAMARELGFKCLAEGAEKKEQVERLKEYGCEVIQGYYFSKPLPVEEYELKLK